MAGFDDLATALFAAATAGQRSGRPVATVRHSTEAVTGKCAEARILVEAALVARGRDHG